MRNAEDPSNSARDLLERHLVGKFHDQPPVQAARPNRLRRSQRVEHALQVAEKLALKKGPVLPLEPDLGVVDDDEHGPLL